MSKQTLTGAPLHSAVDVYVKDEKAGKLSRREFIARTTALHAQIVERLEAANIRATSRIDTEEVSPTRTLLAVAEQEQAETIFLGARGLTGFERFMLGSISSAVAMQADCSVEVVR